MIETSTRNVRVHSRDGVFEKASICKDSFLNGKVMEEKFDLEIAHLVLGSA